MLSARAGPVAGLALLGTLGASLAAAGPVGRDELVIRQLQARFAADRKAAALALALYERTGSVVDVLPAQDFDGGYRGLLRLEPALPVGPLRRHLEQVAGALDSYDELFAQLERRAAGRPLVVDQDEAAGPIASEPPSAAPGGQSRYRWRELDLRFFRSVRRRTPAAFAHGWTVAYNVNGSLNYSTAIVTELLFHEIFHLNDFARGDWSGRSLQGLYASIAARCRTDAACLAPYCPGWVKVKGGTYYAFQPGNDVREYAAELAITWLREQRASLAGRPPARPFKCATAENAAAWALVVGEFFGGHDLVPACARSGGPG